MNPSGTAIFYNPEILALKRNARKIFVRFDGRYTMAVGLGLAVPIIIQKVTNHRTCKLDQRCRIP